MTKAKKSEPVVTMQVRITSSNSICWYRNEIGEVYEVESLCTGAGKVHSNSMMPPRYFLAGQTKKATVPQLFILGSDCEIVE